MTPRVVDLTFWTLSGDSFRAQAPRECSVAALGQLAAKLSGIPVLEQVLLLGHQRLDDLTKQPLLALDGGAASLTLVQSRPCERIEMFFDSLMAQGWEETLEQVGPCLLDVQAGPRIRMNERYFAQLWDLMRKFDGKVHALKVRQFQSYMPLHTLRALASALPSSLRVLDLSWVLPPGPMTFRTLREAWSPAAKSLQVLDLEDCVAPQDAAECTHELKLLVGEHLATSLRRLRVSGWAGARSGAVQAAFVEVRALLTPACEVDFF